MKRLIISALAGLLMLLPLRVMASGTAVLGNVEKIQIDGHKERVVIPITFTADGAAAEATYTLNPVTHGITGWYLLDVYTDPGTTGPTNGAWDLDITDATTGYIVSQTLIDDRSSTVTQRVTGATLGYPTILHSWSITIGDNAVNNAVAIVYLVFTPR